MNEVAEEYRKKVMELNEHFSFREIAERTGLSKTAVHHIGSGNAKRITLEASIAIDNMFRKEGRQMKTFDQLAKEAMEKEKQERDSKGLVETLGYCHKCAKDCGDCNDAKKA